VSLTSSPIGFVSDRDSLSSFNSDSEGGSEVWDSERGVMSLPLEMGRTFSSSSRTRQSVHEPRERMNRSLNRAMTESWDEVR
jgi:hypothetical protein